MSKRIFVSHTTPDDELVNLIAAALRKEGFTPWIDHDPENGVEPGSADWEKAIRDELAVTDAVLFVMSNKSLASTYCKRECSRAETLKKPIYVAKLEEIGEVNEIWLYLEGRQYAPFISRSDTEMKLIIRALNGERASDVPMPVRAQTTTGVDTMRLHLNYLNNPLRGRDEEIAQIQSKLGPHVLQIVGTGGLGKSRLAAEVAMNYPNGAIWQRCSKISEAAELLNLLGNHLSLPADTSVSNVLVVLAEKGPLIVVDNAEEFPADSNKRREYADLLKLITDSKHVPILLTTRAIWTEFKRRVIPLDGVPIEIASQIAADFARAEEIPLTDSEAQELAEKGRRHPRLIEFAVRQLHERALARVLNQLDELKHHEIQNALDKMIVKTVRQMVEQTDNGADAESLLVRMPILQATFPLDAVKAIAPAEMRDDLDQLEDALVTLQRWQFVRRDGSTERYSLGELVREALGQPEEDVFWIYAEFYTELAGEIFKLPPEQWKDHEHDMPNILALGDALVEHMSRTSEHKSLLFQITAKLDKAKAILLFALNVSKFVTTRLEYSRMSWLDMGLKAAQILNSAEDEAHFTYQLGLGWSGLGEYKKALEYSNHALLLLEKLGNRSGQAATYNTLGTIWSSFGEKQKALSYFEQALSLWATLDNHPDKSTLLNNIGKMWADLGQQQRALDFYQQALYQYQEFNHRRGISTVLNNIAGIMDELGRKEQALEVYEQALKIFHSVGDRRGEATALSNMGLILSDLKQYRTALDFFQQALPLTQAVGARDVEATILNSIGTALFNLGKEQEALKHLYRSLEMRHAIGDRSGEATTCFNIGIIYYALRDFEQALMLIERCIELEEQIQHPHLEIARQTLEQLISERDKARGN